MCFSAAANFTGAGVLATLGVATFTQVKHPREFLFASLPTCFAIHQFIEGFVWLGLDGSFSPDFTHKMAAAYMLYAHGLLPFLMPLAVLLFEPTATARRRMLPFLIFGTGTALYMIWCLIAWPIEVHIRGNSLVYFNHGTYNTTLSALYIVVTCGPLFLSKIRAIVLFGAANIAILLIVTLVKRYAFTSLWCAYAAVASIILLSYFWQSRLRRPFRYAL